MVSRVCVIDVSVISWGCFHDVSVMSRFWLCSTDVAVIFWRRFNDSLGMCQDVFGMYW